MERTAALVLVLLLTLSSSPSEAQPQQVHLAYGYDPSQMVVMWSTSEEASSIVLYGDSSFNLTMKAAGDCWEFTKGNPDGLHFLHKVTLQVSAIRGTRTRAQLLENTTTLSVFSLQKHQLA